MAVNKPGDLARVPALASDPVSWLSRPLVQWLTTLATWAGGLWATNWAALPTYADNAAAVAGGLAVGTPYKTATGETRVVV